MKNNYTHVSMVLDRSGSMGSIATDIIGGFNRFIDDQRKAPGECTVTLVQFDSQSTDVLVDGQPVSAVRPLSHETFQPRGSTPLYDAVARTIIRTGDYLAKKPEAERPSKVVFVVITDGLENDSREFDHQKVRDMIEHQTQAYKWEFVFLGANIDSYAVAASMGMSSAKTMNYAGNTASVTAMFASTSSNLRMFRSGLKADMDYEADQRDEQIKCGADQTGSPTK